MINDARVAKGMEPLKLVYADMILTADPSSPRGQEESSTFSNKMSSTLVRAYLNEGKSSP